MLITGRVLLRVASYETRNIVLFAQEGQHLGLYTAMDNKDSA
jgi:hypothetical protein